MRYNWKEKKLESKLYIYSEEVILTVLVAAAMATHAALASSRIPANTGLLPSKTSHSFPAQCLSKRLEVAEFSGLRSGGCATYAKNAREASFFDVVASQVTTKVNF